MKKILFVGEERSATAIRMNVTWKDRRLAAAHLSKATDALGLDWDKLCFKNVFEDDIEDIKSFDGIVVAMGRKVEKQLKKHKIEHEFIYHPATRGAVRNIEKYKNHVRERIGHII
jgi:enamine deaminase RidA (YjgF/YER057c/UK114 family)